MARCGGGPSLLPEGILKSPMSADITAPQVAVSSQIGRVRYRVVAFAVALASVTYLDRICISILAPSMMRDLSLSRMEMSAVFSAFAIAYASFEIPSAWWGEKVGTRRVLTRIVCWWSAFTMLTGLVTNYVVLLAVRFLFGIGEAGAWPNAARTFSKWIPVPERGRVQGLFFAGAFLAGGLTPALVGFLEPHLGWRGVFLSCGVLGVIWAALWYRWFRDEPSEHPQVGAEELAHILKGRGDSQPHHASASVLQRFIGNPSAWALCLGYFSNSYGSYFVMTWLPTYLAEARGFQPGAMALFAGLPMLLAVCSNLIGGVTTDYLSAKLGLRLGRASIGVVSYVVAAIAMMLAAIEQDSQRAAILLAVATASSMFALAAHWASAIDIGGRNSGVLSAAMNTTGQAGSIVSPFVTAYLVQHYANWALPLHVMAALYLFSALTWLFVKPPAEPARA
jgi:MFS transporter, ACS family, glucarate transporter